MKVIVHDVTPEGLKKLEELLQQPQHSHIQVQRTELDGVEQPKIVFDIADHRGDRGRRHRDSARRAQPRHSIGE